MFFSFSHMTYISSMGPTVGIHNSSNAILQVNYD